MVGFLNGRAAGPKVSQAGPKVSQAGPKSIASWSKKHRKCYNTQQKKKRKIYKLSLLIHFLLPTGKSLQNCK